jgi:hypothetical protein
LSEDGTDDSIMECIPVYENCAAQCDYHKWIQSLSIV